MFLKTNGRAKVRALLTHDVDENKATVALAHDMYESKGI
jgi:hypothetical protein